MPPSPFAVFPPCSLASRPAGRGIRVRCLSVSLLAGLALGWALPRPAAAAEMPERPDILFILTDDQAFDLVGALGLADVETPNLDRLVEGGTTFTHAYNMGSYSPAVCVASRAMLNLGTSLWKSQRLAQNLGKAERPHPDLPDFAAEGMMWSQLMSAAGYRTCFAGKWHVSIPPDRVFDEVRNVRGGMPRQTDEGYDRPRADGSDPWSPSDPAFGGFWEGGRHWSEITADDGIELIDLAAASEDPHFIVVAFNAPHDPRQSPQSFIDRYPLERIEVPPNFLPEYHHLDLIDLPRSLRDERLAPFPRTEHMVKVHRQEYFAMVTHLDEQVGRILDHLERSGRGERTVVIFSSDHGLAVGQHGLFGKQNMYDHSLRVPMMIAGPGIPEGKKIASPVYLQDIMPTTLELAGAEVPSHVDFRSMLPAIFDGDGGYEAIYGAYLESQRCVVEDGWKLVLYPRVPEFRLYDLTSDPAETRDLAGDEPARARALFRRFLKLQAEMRDETDLREAFPELAD